MTQRDCMRTLYQELNGNKTSIVQAYAAAERRGEVSRKSNTNQSSPEDYAEALYNDGVKKGWITHS